MSANDNTSTLKSVTDAIAGTAQNVLGSFTGNPEDKRQAQAKKNEAADEYDASHATAKGPGFTASSSGAVTADDPDRAQGSYNQTMGAAKETLGGVLGAEGLKQSGRQQNLEGQQQEAKGQVNDYTSGMGDRISGTVGSAVAGLTGNTGAQAEYQAQHDTGKTQQRGAEHDILKQAEADRK